VQRISRPSFPLLVAALVHLPAHAFQRHERRLQILLGCDARQRIAARRLQVERNACGERREPLDLRGFSARHHLHVDVAGESMLLAQQREHLDQIVHHLYRSPRDSRCEEESGTPFALHGREENSDELRRFEEGARHVPVATHRAVVTVEAARVRHEDAHERGAGTAAPDSHRSQIERPQGAHIVRMAESGRQLSGGEPFAIVASQRHEECELCFEIRGAHHRGLREMESPQYPKKTRRSRPGKKAPKSQIF
jgi:hypothetical protein